MAGGGQLLLDNAALDRGGRRLFSGLTLTLGPGDAAMVSGPNGVGKSSLLRLMAGLLEASEGECRVEGRLALCNEALALDPMLPLGEALQFWSRMDGGDVDAALDALGIVHLAPVPVRMLSTGQRKRAMLARTLAANASIWLLDEPANGLDAGSVPLLEAAIARHRAAGGIIVLASHTAIILPNAEHLELVP
jgi:heme exporter protein A